MIRGRETSQNRSARAQGSALTRNGDIPHGSKNLLQRVILYRHKRYMCVREDCRQYPGETIYGFVMVICKYLWILVFVWALVFCGPRYDQSASIECNGVTQKIHMRKIEVDQGLVSIMEMIDFMIRGS